MTPTKKCRVLHLVYVMGHGGIETFLMSMLRCYDRDRFHMDIAYCGPEKGAYANQVRELGSELIPCKMENDQVRFMTRFYKILKKGGYAAVNSHLSDMGGGAILTAKMAGVPARVASYHTNCLKRTGLKNFYMESMRRIIVRAATDITTSSPDVTASHFTRIPAVHNNVHAISYGVDVDHFAQEDVKPLDIKQFGNDSNDIIIGHVGRFVPQKNHMAIVRIASIVTKHIPHVKFLLCGKEGGLKNNIEKSIEESGLMQHFGFISGIDDMRQFYHSIDLFILPSRHEGMPISILEAQACGKPVIASRLKGIEIAVAKEMHGNLFEVDDVDSFGHCVIDLLRNKEKRLSLGNFGYQHVKQNFDISLAVRKYEKMYLNQLL